MTVASPAYLFLLILVPLTLLAVVRGLTWRAGARRRFGGLPSESALARAALVLTPALLLLSIVFAAVAAARPQFDDRSKEVEEKGINLAIVLDLSSSMLAEDALASETIRGGPAPDATTSRLALAQQQIIALLDNLQGDRIGLVVFARDPFLRSPLTADTVALRTLIDGVDGERGLIEPGSDLGAAIVTATKLLNGAAGDSRAMVIVSDGEDHGESIAPAVAAARAANIRIYTAGVGSSAGASVLDTDPITGETTARLDATGAPVITRLDEQALRAIAADASGRYVRLGDGGESLTTLTADFEEFASTVFGKRETALPIERFQIFAALALLLADVELMLLAIPRKGRSRLASLAKLWPIAAPTIFIAALCTTTVADINNDANDAYARADYPAALDLYRTAQSRDPRPELNHNISNTLSQQAAYEAAIEEALLGLEALTDRSAGAPARKRCAATPSATTSTTTQTPAPCSPVGCDPPPTQQTCLLLNRLNYALGNHYIAATQLFDALNAYRRALLADSADDDARHNYEVIAKRLTPSPTPTPTAIGIDGTPRVTTTAGANTDGSSPSDSTPGPNDRTAFPPPTPQDPNDPRNLSDEELRRTLEEALAGIDRVLTPEEAVRLLELLQEENRRSIEDTTSDQIRPTLPDY